MDYYKIGNFEKKSYARGCEDSSIPNRNCARSRVGIYLSVEWRFLGGVDTAFLIGTAVGDIIFPRSDNPGRNGFDNQFYPEGSLCIA